MRRFHSAAMALSTILLASCASQSTKSAEMMTGDASLLETGSPGQTELASYQQADRPPEVCEPKVVDQRAELSDDCLNRIEHVPYDGKRYEAIGRETRELKSLCDSMFLPRCRRKY